jgi:hypothetical protein
MTLSQLVRKISRHPKPQGSLLYSQKPSSGPYSGSGTSSPHL